MVPFGGIDDGPITGFNTAIDGFAGAGAMAMRGPAKVEIRIL
jgi:hypothetical protein